MKLRTARSQQVADRVGWYFITDGDRVVRTHVDLEAYARELGVLEPWEELAEVPKGTKPS
jgi:hypothetical protein